MLNKKAFCTHIRLDWQLLFADVHLFCCPVAKHSTKMWMRLLHCLFNRPIIFKYLYIHNTNESFPETDVKRRTCWPKERSKFQSRNLWSSFCLMTSWIVVAYKITYSRLRPEEVKELHFVSRVTNDNRKYVTVLLYKYKQEQTWETFHQIPELLFQ